VGRCRRRPGGTDEGAKTLARNDDLKNREFLDLSHNALTAEGIHALQETGIKFDASHQHGQVPGRGDPYTGWSSPEAGDCE
jgi:hypothetical protein